MAVAVAEAVAGYCYGDESAVADTTGDDSKNRKSSDVSFTVFPALLVCHVTYSSEHTRGRSLTHGPKMANEEIFPRTYAKLSLVRCAFT